MKGIKHDFRIEEILADNKCSESDRPLLLPVSHDKAANAGYVLFQSAVFKKCIYNVEVAFDNLKAFIQNPAKITTAATAELKHFDIL